MKILLIEDDKSISETVSKELVNAGYDVQTEADGDSGFKTASLTNFDLLIVDVMLPSRDGFSVVEELRSKNRNFLALFLTAKRSVKYRIEGLRRGGDDYLTKPFSLAELLARCDALLRRVVEKNEINKLIYRNLELDVASRIVKRGGETIELQQKEFCLLEFLLRGQGQVFSKTQLLGAIWKYDFDPQTNVVDVLIFRLRSKIDRNSEEKLIRTIRGVGYVLRTD